MVKSLLIESPKAATEEMMDRVRTAVGFPCIVKPNRGAACTGNDHPSTQTRAVGVTMCNVGVTKVPSRKELKDALDLAFRHDSQAVLEPCVSDGVEVTCTVHDITGDELLEVSFS